MTNLTVVYYLVSVTSNGLSFERQEDTFNGREGWLRFARSCYNSAGDVALDDEWFSNLRTADQEAITS